MNDKLQKLQDRSDAARWAHPELVDIYGMMTGLEPMNRDFIYNFDLPIDERKAAIEQLLVAFSGMVGADLPEDISVQNITVKGCPEDPDLEVELVIYRNTMCGADKLPVIYEIAGGGMHVCMLEPSNLWKLAQRNACAVVCPRYVGVYEAKYPTQLNQLHAGYKYVVEHAEELGFIDDQIILHGASSGSNLALSLAHRLKRYGYHPKGCVVESSFADNRPIFPSSTIKVGGCWDAACQWRSSVVYLGENSVSAFNTAEMYPNYATAEECIGLCPTFIHTEGEDANVSTVRAYSEKLTQAGVYNELHVWGGGVHACVGSTGDGGDFFHRVMGIVDGNIQDCFKYDLRRLWQQEELGE